MEPDYGTVGPPSEKTERNIRRAKAFSVWAGPVHIEWKFHTGQFRVIPRWEVMTTEFWNEGPVRWVRGYWLTIGLSWHYSLPERRTLDVPYRDIPGLQDFERRTYPYGLFAIRGGLANGTRKEHAGRASED